MKPKNMRYHVQSARIYRQHYKPSYNVIRLLKSVLTVLMHGSSAAMAGANRRHK